MDTKRAIIFVDVIRGFTDLGVFASKECAKLVPAIEAYNLAHPTSLKAILIDSHDLNSTELEIFPEHCTCGGERELKISQTEYSYVFHKNSTNGLFAPEFADFIKVAIEQGSDFYIVGFVTHICVMNLAISLKNILCENNYRSKVNVVSRLVGGGTDEEKKWAYYFMKLNGVNVV